MGVPVNSAVGSSGTQGATAGPIVAPDHLPNLSQCVAAHTLKPRGLRRLTGDEVSKTLTDIFAAIDVPDGDDAFGGDSTVYNFDSIQSVLNVTEGGVVALQIYGEAVGNYAAQHMAVVSSCTTLDANCRVSFITTFGKKMFRRRLTDDEMRGFDGLMGSASAFAEGVRAVVSAMVQSPYFLYRTELGSPDPNHPGQWALGRYEVASALSYLFMETAPDGALMAAADANALGDANARMLQAQRLMATPQGITKLGKFMLQWLQVDALDATARTDVPLTGLSDLTAFLATSDAAGACFARHWAATQYWGGSNSTVTPISAPTTAWQTLFGGSAAPTTGDAPYHRKSARPEPRLCRQPGQYGQHARV